MTFTFKTCTAYAQELAAHLIATGVNFSYYDNNGHNFHIQQTGSPGQRKALNKVREHARANNQEWREVDDSQQPSRD